MPRTARRKSSTGYYHIMMRGVNRQIIFTEDSDYSLFIYLLKKYSQELEVNVIAYCLMTNHFHLLINSDNPAMYVKKLSSAYVKYYNTKNNRIGHLFQERFKSEPVENDTYLLTVTRYILQNPQKAGIADFDQYPWNSWQEFRYPVFCKPNIILDISGGLDNFTEYMKQKNNDKCVDINEAKYLQKEEVVQYVLMKFGLSQIEDFHDYSMQKITQMVKELKEEGFSGTQISDATGLSRGQIQKM